MKPKTYKVNPAQLRKKLIQLYSGYVKDLNNPKVIETSKDMDGNWSGSFLLDRDLEAAIDNLTFLYAEPRLPLEVAKKILKDLEEKND